MSSSDSLKQRYYITHQPVVCFFFTSEQVWRRGALYWWLTPRPSHRHHHPGGQQWSRGLWPGSPSSPAGWPGVSPGQWEWCCALSPLLWPQSVSSREQRTGGNWPALSHQTRRTTTTGRSTLSTDILLALIFWKNRNNEKNLHQLSVNNAFLLNVVLAGWSNSDKLSLLSWYFSLTCLLFAP